MDILNRLRDNSLSQPDGPSRDRELEPVNALIEASEVSKEKGNLKALNKVRDRMESFNEYKFYRSSYLKHHWHDRFVLCKNWLNALLERDIEALSVEDQESIGHLRDTITQDNMLVSNKDHKRKIGFDVSPSILESGLSRRMKLNSKHSMTEYLYHYNGKTFFSQEFLRLIGRPCLRFGKKLENSEKAFALFEADLNIKNELDMFTVKWIENIALCRAILTNVESISTGVYNKFGKAHGTKGDQMQQIISAMIPKILSNNGPNEKRIIPYAEQPKSRDDGLAKRRNKPEKETKKHWYELEWGDMRSKMHSKVDYLFRHYINRHTVPHKDSQDYSSLA